MGARLARGRLRLPEGQHGLAVGGVARVLAQLLRQLPLRLLLLGLLLGRRRRGSVRPARVIRVIGLGLPYSTRRHDPGNCGERRGCTRNVS